MSYGWPGNVRELENVLEGLVLGATGDSLEREDLPAVFRERPPATLEEPLFDGLPSLEQMEKRLRQLEKRLGKLEYAAKKKPPPAARKTTTAAKKTSSGT